MASPFAAIAFTSGVKAAQSRYGSRDANRRLEAGDAGAAALTAAEARFIARRDSFYQATVSETGWPYVQHRGGPAGFLKVLDATTLAYADYSGNRQYVSAGNLAGNDRVALILVDYAQRRRLKLWGRARIVHAVDDRALVDAVRDPSYPARVERAIVIAVSAYAWNCPSHIPQRYAAADFDDV